jgi:hypothetical protein
MVFLLIVGLSAVLCFCGLGRRTLWQDEGETAVLAQRVLIYGIPRALDGYNLVYQEPGGLYQYDKNYLWTYHPWGQFYLTAASFAVLGQTTFAARFPFAVCGVLTVALLYVFVWRHWRSPAVAALSALLLATSTAFVLHCRQCRYYGLSAFTCLLVVVVFVEMMKRPCRQWWIMFGVALAAQFYTDFGTLVVILPSLVISLWSMNARRGELIATAKGFALAVLLIMPGLLLHRHRLVAAGGGNHTFLSMLWPHICFFDNWFVPLLFLVPAAAVFVLRQAKSDRCLSEQNRIIITCVFVICADVAGMAWIVPGPSVHYLMPSISLAKLVLGMIFVEGYVLLRQKGLSLMPAKIIVIAGFFILMFSDVFSLPVQYFVRGDEYKDLDFCSKSKPFIRTEFTGLIYEITHDFVCPDRLAVNLVDSLVEPEETAAASYGELVLMFYRPDVRVYGPDTLSNAAGAPDLFILGKTPWLINIEEWLKKYAYIQCLIPVPVATFGGNFPEPSGHYFSTSSRQCILQVYLRRDHENRISKLPKTAEELEVYLHRCH